MLLLAVLKPFLTALYHFDITHFYLKILSLIGRIRLLLVLADWRRRLLPDSRQMLVLAVLLQLDVVIQLLAALRDPLGQGQFVVSVGIPVQIEGLLVSGNGGPVVEQLVFCGFPKECARVLILYDSFLAKYGIEWRLVRPQWLH